MSQRSGALSSTWWALGSAASAPRGGQYPTEFNGCFAACPDPVDFRAYTTINIYEDDNAYYYPGAPACRGAWTRVTLDCV